MSTQIQLSDYFKYASKETELYDSSYTGSYFPYSDYDIIVNEIKKKHRYESDSYQNRIYMSGVSDVLEILSKMNRIREISYRFKSEDDVMESSVLNNNNLDIGESKTITSSEPNNSNGINDEDSIVDDISIVD